METFLKELPQYFSIATIFPTIAFICIKIRNNSQFFMPSEYKVIRNIINKIASKIIFENILLPLLLWREVGHIG